MWVPPFTHDSLLIYAVFLDSEPVWKVRTEKGESGEFLSVSYDGIL